MQALGPRAGAVDEKAEKQLVQLLTAPLEQYSVVTVLSLGSYPQVMNLLPPAKLKVCRSYSIFLLGFACVALCHHDLSSLFPTSHKFVHVCCASVHFPALCVVEQEYSVGTAGLLNCKLFSRWRPSACTCRCQLVVLPGSCPQAFYDRLFT